MVGGLHFKVIKPRPRNPRGLHFGAIRLFFLRWKVRIFPGSSVYIRQAIARQSPSSACGVVVGWSKPRCGGARKGGRRAQRGCIERRHARRDVRPTCCRGKVKAGLAAPGEAELPRERLFQASNAAYDAAHFATRHKPVSACVKKCDVFERVRRGSAAIAFCPRSLRPSFLSLPGPLAEARPF